MTEKKNKKILYIEILGDLATAAIKFVFGIIGNSSVMIAEGFHSIADTANQIFLLVGVYSSKRTPDIKHQFGYGKEKFFWAFLSAPILLTYIYLLDFPINRDNLYYFEYEFSYMNIKISNKKPAICWFDVRGYWSE